MERRKFLLASIGSAFAALLAPALAVAASGDIAQAIDEIQKAIPYGVEPAHSSSFVQHVDNAIDHAVTAQKAQANPHVKKAIGYLRRARKIAYGTHLLRYSRRGAALAKRALTELQAAQ
ncbi:MAG TPA: small metal-binding protein SmbP [Methylocystis sp.]|nr:small metal-binding protein SmbP [Methylocystis sp.]